MLEGVTQAVRRVRRTVYEWHCTCQRCGHAWVSLRPSLPITCPAPKCKARNWQRAARPYNKKK